MIRSMVLIAALLAANACAKSEPTPETAPAEPTATTAATPAAVRGLPMWVIRDADSTIYLTGTIHILPPDLEWRSPKLEAALDEAKELWLEIAIPADRAQFQRDTRPLFLKHARLSGPPLSSRLTEKERKALDEALDRAGVPVEARDEIDRMQPWYAANLISVGTYVSAGYSGDAGIDNTLARMAYEQGDAVRGLETVEFQLGVISGQSE
ncbi:MAG TPA: TraB/GumN family protein, partial [Hyphomonadaceae bacterium]|nr:TraB/GumN family protein [Hyphomonadaceae bacterium]